jgi:hypothetical protein
VLEFPLSIHNPQVSATLQHTYPTQLHTTDTNSENTKVTAYRREIHACVVHSVSLKVRSVSVTYAAAHYLWRRGVQIHCPHPRVHYYSMGVDMNLTVLAVLVCI